MLPNAVHMQQDKTSLISDDDVDEEVDVGKSRSVASSNSGPTLMSASASASLPARFRADRSSSNDRLQNYMNYEI